MADEIVFKVRITKQTYSRLRTASLVRSMSGVNGGLIDAFVQRLLTCIEEGKTEYLFEIKKDVD